MHSSQRKKKLWWFWFCFEHDLYVLRSLTTNRASLSVIACSLNNFFPKMWRVVKGARTQVSAQRPWASKSRIFHQGLWDFSKGQSNLPPPPFSAFSCLERARSARMRCPWEAILSPAYLPFSPNAPVPHNNQPVERLAFCRVSLLLPCW